MELEYNCMDLREKTQSTLRSATTLLNRLHENPMKPVRFIKAYNKFTLVSHQTSKTTQNKIFSVNQSMIECDQPSEGVACSVIINEEFEPYTFMENVVTDDRGYRAARKFGPGRVV